MTKFFILGDFHGKLSNSIFNKIKKEKPDFILSPGDFCGNKRLGKIIFKYIYHKSYDEVSSKIKKEYEHLEHVSFSAGVSVINKLKKLKITIIAIHGNWDPTPYPYDIGGDKKLEFGSFKKLEDKTFRLSDFSLIKHKDFILVCGGSSSCPGIPSFDKFKEEFNMSSGYMEKQEALIYFLKARREYSRRKHIYKKLFTKAKRISKGRKIIFMTHNCPYKTKLDIIKNKNAPKSAKKKHTGSFLERKIIEKFQPNIVICGHMHENFGQDKIGKSIIYNAGSAADGKFKILEI